MKKILLCAALIAGLHIASFAEDVVPFTGVEITKGAIYRSTLGRTGVFNKTGVVNNPSVKWTANIGGKLSSSPVGFEGKVFVGGAKGFYALDAETGKIAWEFPAKGGVDSSACIANDIVCFTDNNGSLYAVNINNGGKLWSYKTKSNPNGTKQSKSSPAIAYGVVYCAINTEIVALNLMTGKKIWSLTGKKANYPAGYSSIALTKDTLFLLGGSNWDYMWGYDLETSKCTFKSGGPFVAGAGVYLINTPAVDINGNIAVNNTRNIKLFTKEKYDKERWDLRYPKWNNFLLDKEVDDNELIEQSAASIWKDKVFGGRTDGKFVALNKANGKIIWKKNFPAEILSDPSVAAKSNLVIFGCYDGNVYALDTQTGETKWSFKTGGRIFASPWVEDGAVYISSQDGTLYCLK